ncbi:hypothetical protein AiwAL_04915 [Acidiphilium sp. AL]|uniref:Uncharacterized protein n=1 Tax=Acidiphilium iwatense TaxID=768198 RepID=A0ABS9DSU9_9PROT|nr:MULTISPECIES: hypothetical protein [Acidiphilium]MCF3945260.1 hypothetical protein [Acidiphilium iwatense]MCU4159445.1 hypothetical protein [Acidiphilium sp. AL]
MQTNAVARCLKVLSIPGCRADTSGLARMDGFALLAMTIEARDAGVIVRR